MHDLGAGRFSLDVTEPPPSEAFFPRDTRYPNDMYVGGEVAAYVDGNANGALDFATPDRPSPDQIVGVSERSLFLLVAESGSVGYAVFYSEEEHQGLPRGYSVNVGDNSSVSQVYMSKALITSPIPIALQAEPTVRAQICTDICKDDSFDQSPPPTVSCPATPVGLPKKIGSWSCRLQPTDPTLSEFVWRHVICNGCECRMETCVYYHHTNALPTPDWPCGAVASWTEYAEP
jgi:hypothetical protein